MSPISSSAPTPVPTPMPILLASFIELLAVSPFADAGLEDTGFAGVVVVVDCDTAAFVEVGADVVPILDPSVWVVSLVIGEVVVGLSDAVVVDVAVGVGTSPVPGSCPLNQSIVPPSAPGSLAIGGRNAAAVNNGTLPLQVHVGLASSTSTAPGFSLQSVHVPAFGSHWTSPVHC